MKKIFQILMVIGAFGIGILFAIKPNLNILNKRPDSPPTSKASLEKTPEESEIKIDNASDLENKELFNILLLGIDRRSKTQSGYNTDTMILLSVNTKNNVALLTSVPRDLWINGGKINALYSTQGEDTLLNAFEQITDLEMDGYIRCDFEDFRWIVDTFGGIPVDVERNFTDPSFPNNSDTGIKTVSFEEGVEKMQGDRALVFARSRKGNNGEGSDLMRARRQHRILVGMVEGISQPANNFWPMDLPKFYEAVTQRMHTTLKLTDVKYLWDFYKDRKEYKVISFVVDDTYVYHPGMHPNSEYHAWVFIPREGSFKNLHQDIKDILYPKPEDNSETNNESNDLKEDSESGEVLTFP